MEDKKSKIKVVIGINDFLVGGAQKLITDQLKYFDYNKYDITLITLFLFDNHSDFYDTLPPTTKLMKFKFTGFLDVRSWYALCVYLKQNKPTVVISHLFFSNTIFRLLKIFFGYKIIIVEHNTYINKPKWQIWTDKLLSYLTFKIVAVSKTVKTFTAKQENISISHFELIYNGIDMEPIRKYLTQSKKEELKTKLGFSAPDHVLLNVARLTAQKNQKLLIESFALFSRGNPNYKLIILGEGSLFTELQEQIKMMGVSDKVFLLGAKKNIFDYYLVSDFLVSVSSMEGLSIAYLEAMAFGLPIVSTKTAGTDELIRDGENGYFIYDANPQKVADLLVKVLDSDIVKLSENAAKTAPNFDIKNNVAKYGALIENISKFNQV